MQLIHRDGRTQTIPESAYLRHLETYSRAGWKVDEAFQEPEELPFEPLTDEQTDESGSELSEDDQSEDESEPVDDGKPVALDINAMTRDALNVYAGELGIELPESLPNKAAVVAAIEDVLTQPSEDE